MSTPVSIDERAGLEGEIKLLTGQLLELRAENERLQATLCQVIDESAERVRQLAEANERVGWECSALLSHLEQDAENFVSRGELITRLRMWMKWFSPHEAT